MKVLLDHNMPIQLAPLLSEHHVVSAKAMVWDLLSNGALLAAAETDGFQAMVTADQGIFYQQNNARRRISLVVLNTNFKPSVLDGAEMIASALSRTSPGSFERVIVGPSRPSRRRAIE